MQISRLKGRGILWRLMCAAVLSGCGQVDIPVVMNLDPTASNTLSIQMPDLLGGETETSELVGYMDTTISLNTDRLLTRQGVYGTVRVNEFVTAGSALDIGGLDTGTLCTAVTEGEEAGGTVYLQPLLRRKAIFQLTIPTTTIAADPVMQNLLPPIPLELEIDAEAYTDVKRLTQLLADGTGLKVRQVLETQVPDDVPLLGGSPVTIDVTMVSSDTPISDAKLDVCAAAWPECGNGVVEVGETCDPPDGETCDDSCQSIISAECGNGVVEEGEECDDGNTSTEACDYGQMSCLVCDATCHEVAGSTSYCGDGELDAANGEACEPPNTATCDGSCQEIIPAECGNGIVEAGEECDDGNTITETCAYGQPDCIVCSATCGLVPGETSYCGDLTLDTANGEQCDDGNTTTETCDYGQTSCLVCDGFCQQISGETSYCGDGAVDVANGEQCEPPNTPSCDADCQAIVPECGNGVLEAGEECDDGNNVNEPCAYGETSCIICSAICSLAPGATSYCGDDVLDAASGEQCDDGNAITEACDYGETACTVCDAGCQEAPGATSYCGDNDVDGSNGEQCEPPNTSTCDANCQAIALPECGDGEVGGNEECDDGNATTETCEYGETSCTVCSATCELVAGATSYCGDNSIDVGHGEDCDDGNSVTEACDYGETSCTVCSSICTLVPGTTSYCGDNSIDAANGETCDDGNTTTEPCAYGETSCVVCDGICQEAAGATSYCGDNAIDTDNGEACDDGNTQTETCDYGQTSCLVCDGYCREVSGAVSYCGDTVVDGANGEECDDGNAVTETCDYGQTACLVCDDICQEVAGETSYCGDDVIDLANGEECEPPNTSTCDAGCREITGVDLTGTWVAQIQTLGTLEVPVVGVADANLTLVLRVLITRSGSDLVEQFEICSMDAVTTPNPNDLVLTFTPEAIATMTATATIPEPVVMVGDPVPMPQFVVLTGIDAADNPVDSDGDGFDGITIPTVIGGFIVTDAYSGMVITTDMNGSLETEDVITGNADFSAVGQVFSFSTAGLPGGPINVLPATTPVPITATRLEGDVPCSEVVLLF